jgi:hypothetical protein
MLPRSRALVTGRPQPSKAKQLPCHVAQQSPQGGSGSEGMITGSPGLIDRERLQAPQGMASRSTIAAARGAVPRDRRMNNPTVAACSCMFAAVRAETTRTFTQSTELPLTCARVRQCPLRLASTLASGR